MDKSDENGAVAWLQVAGAIALIGVLAKVCEWAAIALGG